MATIQAKLLTVKDKVFDHNKRKESPSYHMESNYDKNFIYTESKLFETYNNFELLKAFTHKKNNDYIEENPIGPDGKKRRKLKNNIELLTEVVINFDKEIFENINNPQKIHQDAEKLAIDFFAKELGFQILSVATHLDEHMKEQKGIRNYHTHITLLNYNFNTHKTVKRTLSKKHLISIQDMVAKQYEKYGFTRGNRNSEEIALMLSTQDKTPAPDTAKVVELQNEIAQRNNLIKSLQEKLLMQSEEIEKLKNKPAPKVQEIKYDTAKIEQLEKKNESLSTIIKLIMEELNISNEEISNMNIHAVDEIKEVIYKKLDMLKLYEFLNVGFAPTEEEVHLNDLEEKFRNSITNKNTPSTTINITTDDF